MYANFYYKVLSPKLHMQNVNNKMQN